MVEAKVPNCQFIGTTKFGLAVMLGKIAICQGMVARKCHLLLSQIKRANDWEV